MSDGAPQEEVYMGDVSNVPPSSWPCPHVIRHNELRAHGMSPPHFCLLRGLTAGFAGCSTARATLLLARPAPGLGLGAGRTASRGVSSAATAARSAGLACSSPVCVRGPGRSAWHARLHGAAQCLASSSVF